MGISFAFDMLLRGDAKELWQETNTNEDFNSNEKCESWFRSTFINDKSLVDKITDLSSVKQRIDEKYRNFEIRVKHVVHDIFESKRSPEEISRVFILNGLRSEKLKESFALQPELNDEKRRELAANLDKFVAKSNVNVVNGSYANAVKISAFEPKFNKVGNDYRGKYFHHKENTPKYSTISRKPTNDSRIANNMQQLKDINEDQRREFPKHSLKYVATKIYNRCHGKAPPRVEFLQHSAFFCCGETNHRRINCPLKNRCLICGKEGHAFRNCALLQRGHNNQRILCIAEQEREESSNECDSLIDFEHDAINILENNEKIVQQPAVSISSVRLH